eukprot:NODE_1867_length_1354_cov_49.404238_g1773_i0.p1 GENE.NODE_1867_length_1354_cov_49.404238_g1773_i0~~NODE_1867_length_1354_cov_49.404238_g1773_i0.p1  ORF type:complete len:426 (+),score=123.42 NODE_1867_length_1354_cov_49.404238_g1773_i0:44-1279(+)
MPWQTDFAAHLHSAPQPSHPHGAPLDTRWDHRTNLSDTGHSEFRIIPQSQVRVLDTSEFRIIPPYGTLRTPGYRSPYTHAMQLGPEFAAHAPQPNDLISKLQHIAKTWTSAATGAPIGCLAKRARRVAGLTKYVLAARSGFDCPADDLDINVDVEAVQSSPFWRSLFLTQDPRVAPTAPLGRVENLVPLTGRRKALLIGIEHEPHSGRLSAVEETRRMAKFLRGQRFNEIRVLVDGENVREQPTRRNIINAMRWLVDGAQRGDSLFFYYTGQSAHQRDTETDEQLAMDEALLPVDYRTAGMLTDDLLHTSLVEPLPEGCCLVGLMDCAALGMDLPYVLRPNDKGLVADFHPDVDGSVIVWAGEGLTHAFLAAITHNPYQTFHELLYSMNFLDTRPVLSMSKHINLNVPFEL